MNAGVLRGNALKIPLRDESVDLIVTSPPYFALRSYRDGGEHYDGQIGSEPTPQAFLEALWAVTAECWRVLKPSGSMFVNLGDKRSGSGAPGTTSGLGGSPQGDRTGMTSRASTSGSERGSTLGGTSQQRRAGSWARDDEARNTRAPLTKAYNQAAFGRAKSKMLLPHRYAIGCEDGLADPDGIGWIVRQDLVWSKPNGLPESVRDRTRDAHEYWFHLTKQGDYFAAVDEIRRPQRTAGEHHEGRSGYVNASGVDGGQGVARSFSERALNPLGALPRSVWEIATEPLKVPEWLGVDHFAAFPTEWPRRLILGWSPSGICTACGEGRAPVVSSERVSSPAHGEGSGTGKVHGRTEAPNDHRATDERFNRAHSIDGYACACPDSSAPTRPAVVLDPFSGTGTTAMVARALGRFGISLDLSSDYCRLASWRIFESGGGAKAIARTDRERQGVML